MKNRMCNNKLRRILVPSRINNSLLYIYDHISYGVNTIDGPITQCISGANLRPGPQQDLNCTSVAVSRMRSSALVLSRQIADRVYRIFGRRTG
jgi:hypothetical protein